MLHALAGLIHLCKPRGRPLAREYHVTSGLVRHIFIIIIKNNYSL